MRFIFFSIVLLICIGSSVSFIVAQTDNTSFPQPTELQHGPPLTNPEFVRLLYQLPAHPQGRDKLIDEIRTRGIAFPITPGLRSLVATKSGNDSSLIRTLEEADRRRANPVVASLPPTAEGLELLERTRKATLGAAEKMPDYLVKQQIIRSHAFWQNRNLAVHVPLTIAVSYRQSHVGNYQLIAITG